jgi:hypothetical protein
MGCESQVRREQAVIWNPGEDFLGYHAVWGHQFLAFETEPFADNRSVTVEAICANAP